ncbi:SusD/RagB family nutrient-binding outer membrane lipoprotein [Chitinophaga varians]|uniref:SusD/RagB family nutrient-binding outer membrane lipoprotein n=1 Tax=Chitinophaga varians TaxID=2202339 RepID=UPI00165F1A04|nr:SusD/RagB family nutrient-binding outer membrane lipoprotein [Chitinophaga varians]MBC9912753.1 SusD/RagB family nutrient-binding outer membrane lipoprotein [Chitinophaga varians]
MKRKILTIAMIAAASVGILSGCKKSQFDERYYDPEKTTLANIDGLYSGLFKNRRIIPNYWNLYTFIAPQMGRYTQTVGFAGTNRMYEQTVNYTQDRWNDFYTSPGSNFSGPIASFREMERLYGALKTDAEKQGYLLFMETARIFVYDQATQMVDLWGDIPFSDAGKLNATGGELILAKYDKGKDVYDSALINLKRISDYLATVQPDPFYQNKLVKQDFILKGDLVAWRKYCNSLLLRLAMRISYQDEAKAKGIVQTLLGNPAKYPLVEAVSENVQIVAKGPDLLSTDMKEGLGNNPAPGYMLDSLMKPSGDPRLRVFFAKNKNGGYFGVPMSWDGGRQTDSIASGFISRIDSVTFVNNVNFPGIILTAAEVSFSKAEAYERWGGGDPKAAYENGIKQSISYYFKINSSSGWGTPAAATSDAEISAMLASPQVAYGTIGREDNLNKIGLQKWADYGVMLSPQSWAEMRRSGYPKLYFPKDVGTTTMPTPPLRLLYPDKERTLNADNFKAVASQDGAYNKIFWQVR